MQACTPSSTTDSRKWRPTTRLPMRRAKPSGKTVRTVSTSPLRMSCVRVGRSSRPGMTRIVAHGPTIAKPARCYAPRVPAARRTIRAWMLYDFANSAFAAIVQATVFPAYYANVVVGNAEGRGDFWWGALVSLSMALVALSSPLLGGIADHAGVRKPLFVSLTALSVVTTALLAAVGPGMILTGFVLGVLGLVTYEAATVYYNSYLPLL